MRYKTYSYFHSHLILVQRYDFLRGWRIPSDTKCVPREIRGIGVVGYFLLVEFYLLIEANRFVRVYEKKLLEL